MIFSKMLTHNFCCFLYPSDAGFSIRQWPDFQYEDFRSRNFSHELIALIRSIFVQIISAIIILFLLKEDRLSRTFIILFSTTSLILMSTEKLISRRIINYLRSKGRNIRSLVLVCRSKVTRRQDSWRRGSR